MEVQEYINNHVSKMNANDVSLTERDELNNWPADVFYYFSANTNLYLTIEHESEVCKNKLIQYLAEHDITLLGSTFTGETMFHVANYGFSKKENKWYGWSHRGIYGFTVGSTCKKGDVHYSPKNAEDYIRAALDFWKDECHEDMHVENVTDTNFDIVWAYSNDTPNEKCRGRKEYMNINFPKNFGRGEWTAQTMEDAKQMAIDYANNIA